MKHPSPARRHDSSLHEGCSPLESDALMSGTFVMPSTEGQPDDTAPGSARRHATVLFADLSGFTAMCSQLDPEDVHETMNSAFALLEEIVVRHGGWVDKYIGDCVMALFGVPKALEEGPRRAINSAIEMRDRLPRLLEARRLPAPLE